MSRKEKRQAKSRVIAYRLPVDLWNKLRERAQRNDRSLGGMTTRLVRSALEETPSIAREA